MRKNKFLVMLLLGVIAVSFLASCHDDDDPKNEKDKERKELLTKHPWYLDEIVQEKITIDLNEDGKLDYKDRYIKIKDCNKDNQHFFKEDGTYIENSFNNACEGQKAHTNVRKGTWHLEGQKLTITVGNETEEYKIYAISHEHLSLDRKFKKVDTEYELNYLFLKELEK